MEGFVALLVMLGIGLFVSGPIAVIMVIVLFNKLGTINRRLNKLEGKPEYGSYDGVPVSAPQPTHQETAEQSMFIETSKPKPSFIPPKPQPISEPAKSMTEVAAATKEFSVLKSEPLSKGGLELKLGTTVALIVGVITVIIGVGFFLKYVYDNMTFSEQMRVCIVAIGGIFAIGFGEVLRRKNFEIVAKGIAALGFALLYAAVFSGSRVYVLFGTEWAFGLSIVVTVAAMAYAVVLDEVLIAFLALLGGYLSPVIISTGQNLPMPLFSYVFVLSSGAMGCAMFRRWRAVNWVAMVGTYLLYTGWFEKFYTPDQIQTSLLWLGVFGSMYLVLPILNGLVKKLIARSEDVTLVVVNSIAVYYYLWQIFYSLHLLRDLSVASLILGTVHIAMVFVVIWRCRDDKKLQASLGVVGTAFLAVAIPMYFNALQPTLIGWSIEAVVLTFMGIRYKSLWTKAMAALISAVAAAGLFYHLPLHNNAEFQFVFNSAFGTWVWVSAAVLFCHGLWRFVKDKDEESSLMGQFYYALGIFLLGLGCVLEWYAHCEYQIIDDAVGSSSFLMGTVVLAGLVVLLFLARPLPPQGLPLQCLGALSALGGSLWTALVMTEVYHDGFLIFANIPFMFAVSFVATLLLAAWLISRNDDNKQEQFGLPTALVLGALLLVWVLVSEQIYQYFWCQNKYVETLDNWRRLSEMYISVAWAVYAAVLIVLGFVFRAAGIRYLSLLILAVLLGKINLDVWNMGPEYMVARIATFLTTGLILVGISLLYQYLKNKGFFNIVALEYGQKNIEVNDA